MNSSAASLIEVLEKLRIRVEHQRGLAVGQSATVSL
jgi:hypothetical protein